MTNIVERLNISWRRRLPLIRQTEAAECGVACLAMVAGWHGLRVDMAGLRSRFGVTQHGMTLARLMECAETLGFSCRPLRLEIEELSELACPCILHWDLSHFVVLKRVTGGRADIHDPAHGSRSLPLNEVSKHFTGVALELIPSQSFQPRDARQRVKLTDLIGRTLGLKAALSRIFLFALFLEILALVMPFTTQLVIDEVLVARDESLLTLVVIGMVLIATSQTLVGLVRDWAVMSLSRSFSIQWSANVFRHLVRLPVDWFEKRHIGDISAKFDAVGQIQRGLTTSLLEVLLDALLVIGTFAMLLLYSPSLTLVVVIGAALYGLSRWLWFGRLRQAADDVWIAGTRESSHFLETMRGILSLRVNGAVSRREMAWRNLIVDTRNLQIVQDRLGAAFHAGTTLMSMLVTAGVMWVGARTVLGGGFSVGMLVAYIAFQNRFTTSSVQLIDKVSEFRMLSVYSERLADIVLAPTEDALRSRGDSADADGAVFPADADAAHLRLLTGSREPGNPVLEVERVRFTYGESMPDILRDASLVLYPGEVVALAGRSGGGKTTLVKLILGIYRPQAGVVRVLGTETAAPSFTALRQKIGTVLQEDSLFSGSLLDNITLFVHDSNLERAAHCARLAQMHGEIMALPMGYHTRVGEMGSTLSGGQRQRLLLARALYKDPFLLILDEATSHLDVQNEMQIAATLRQLGLPILLIAHRPETLAAADRVLMLEEGQVVSSAAPRLAVANVASD